MTSILSRLALRARLPRGAAIPSLQETWSRAVETCGIKEETDDENQKESRDCSDTLPRPMDEFEMRNIRKEFVLTHYRSIASPSQEDRFHGDALASLSRRVARSPPVLPSREIPPVSVAAPISSDYMHLPQ